MFANDRNIGIIEQLAAVVKDWLQHQGEYTRLEIIEKTVRLITAVAIAAVMGVLIIIMCLFLSFALAYHLAPCMGITNAFCCVAAIYVVLLVVFLCFRRQLIERPLVRFLTNLLIKH